MERSRSFHRSPRDIQDLDIQERIGDGLFGIVWKARNKWSGEVVAVKKIRGSNVASKLEFLKEAKILKTMRHENLLRLLAMFVVDDDNVACGAGLYLVTEFCEGGDLSKRLTGGKDLPWPVRLQYALDIAQGLLHLHKKHIIHRDLKCGNCLLYDRPRMYGSMMRVNTQISTRSEPGITKKASSESVTQLGVPPPQRARSPKAPSSAGKRGQGTQRRRASVEGSVAALFNAASSLLKHPKKARRGSSEVIQLDSKPLEQTSRKSSASTVSHTTDTGFDSVSTVCSVTENDMNHRSLSARARAPTVESTRTELMTSSRVLLADFGLARWYSGFEQGNKPSVMTICGTPWTMAPELMRMKNSQGYSSSCDIFSYGVVLCEIITRMKAVDLPRTNDMGIDIKEIERTILQSRTQRLHANWKEYGELVPSLIQLAKDCCGILPEKRPTANQVVERLELMVQSLSELVVPDSTQPHRRRSLNIRTERRWSTNTPSKENRHLSLDRQPDHEWEPS